MTTSAHEVHYTYAEYLALERASNVKHEYLGGQIYAMAGGTPTHAALAAAMVGLIFGQLEKGCRAFSSNLRVQVEKTGLATYPDVTVVCGRQQRASDDADAVTNPVLIAEVLSKSTEAYDQGEKFEHYQQIASLEQYVLIAQDRRAVEVWTRDEDGGWSRADFADGDRALLSAIGASLDVRRLYDAAVEPESL